jgi:hypothetical protein
VNSGEQRTNVIITLDTRPNDSPVDRTARPDTPTQTVHSTGIVPRRVPTASVVTPV